MKNLYCKNALVPGALDIKIITTYFYTEKGSFFWM